MSKPEIVEGLDPCEDCGAPWIDEGNGTPTQTHTEKCWTAPRKTVQISYAINPQTGDKIYVFVQRRNRANR